MTKYYVTLIYVKADGTDDHSTNAYDTAFAAEQAFHSAMVTGMGKDQYSMVSAMMFKLSEDGIEINQRRVVTR